MFDLSKRANVHIGIEMSKYCEAATTSKIDTPVIRAVDDVESAGSGFLSESKRPKILFEGHYFYKALARLGLAEKAARIEPTICYPVWTKAHYVGREGEYTRIAKATELCHHFDISDAIALQSASWGRYQIMGLNFRASGYDDVFDFVEAMFTDEALHLIAFLKYVDHAFLIDDLRKLPTNPLRFSALFALGYNGHGYKRNNYDHKIANAFKRFEAQHIDCSQVVSGMHVVAAMPGLREANPTGFDNTSLDDRYVDRTQDENDGSSVGTIDAAVGNAAADDSSAGNGADDSSDQGSDSGSDDATDQSSTEISQKAGVITNVGDTGQQATLDAAKNLPDTVVDSRGHTKFLTKMWATVAALATGQYVIPDFVQKQFDDLNLLDLIGKLFHGLWTFRYVIVGSVIVWFLVYQYKDYKIKHHQIVSNTDPLKGNVVIPTTPYKRGIFDWLRTRF